MKNYRTRSSKGISRRQFLATAGVATVAAPFVLRQPSRAASNSLVFVTWGGSYRTGLEEGIIKPFTAETGINVTVIDTPDLAKVKAQITTGNVEWDVFDAIGGPAFSGSAEGFWEPLSASLFDASDLSVPVEADMVPLYTAPGVVAYNSDRSAEGQYPTNFTEYFDLEKFPGRRTLRNRPFEALEMALLADGVAPAELYPLDVDRAFKKLETIKPNIVKWVEATQETISLLQTGETDFTYTYPTRVKNAGPPMACSLEQTLSQVEYLTVLKGAPNKENAFKFLSFALRPEVQAATMEQIVNRPVSKKAFEMLSPEARKWLPTAEADVMIDSKWWAGNLESVNRRFKEWVML